MENAHRAVPPPACPFDTQRRRLTSGVNDLPGTTRKARHPKEYSTIEAFLRIVARHQLVLLNGAVGLACLAIIYLPDNPLRIALGTPLAMFLPGYAAMEALKPRAKPLHRLERAALSVALSIAILALVGLVHNFMPWGIRLKPVLYSLAAFTVAASAVAWIRGRGQRHDPQQGAGSGTE